MIPRTCVVVIGTQPIFDVFKTLLRTFIFIHPSQGLKYLFDKVVDISMRRIFYFHTPEKFDSYTERSIMWIMSSKGTAEIPTIRGAPAHYQHGGIEADLIEKASLVVESLLLLRMLLSYCNLFWSIPADQKLSFLMEHKGLKR